MRIILDNMYTSNDLIVSENEEGVLDGYENKR
jgi:hypothetical protein